LAPTIDFWFSIGSTYTYLSVSRLAQIQQAGQVQFRWRPFDLRAIGREMNYRPFSDKPLKLAYMWRDLERRCALRGIPFNGRPPYPVVDLPRPNRIALVGAARGWCDVYVATAYWRWFLAHEDASGQINIARSLATVGQDAESVMALADSEATRRALDAQTQAAKSLGIFGSPTFAVGGEIFWGDDRLDDAIQWALTGRLAPPAGTAGHPDRG
jgi:2-hydroxychromene-2-carboxylate isomerase